jgi:hypothetical protein
MEQSVYMAGTELEAGHHVQALRSRMAVSCLVPTELLSVAKPGDLVLFYSEHFDRFREACIELQRRRVATLYLLDGILEWRNAWENRSEEPACPWTMRPVISDVAACIGQSQARVLAGWGNFGRLEIIGVPRFEQQRLRYLSGELKPRNEDGRFRLLVMTAKCPGFTPGQVETTKRSLCDLRDAFPRQLADGRAVEVDWRLTAGLDQHLQVSNRLNDLSGRELAEILLDYDAVISTPSTAGLEAMLAGRPLAWLDYHGTPQLTPAAWSIGHRDDIPRVIAELASPPASKLVWQSQLLRDHVYLAESATDRLAQLVQRMLEQAKADIQSGNPLRFSDGIITPARPVENRFEHTELYPSFKEFKERDLLVAQTEWAHARREITHLQAELRQARSELAEAHAIFEEIQKHPVAGPIVRLRQKLIEHWRNWRKEGPVVPAQAGVSEQGTPTP